MTMKMKTKLINFVILLTCISLSLEISFLIYKGKSKILKQWSTALRGPRVFSKLFFQLKTKTQPKRMSGFLYLLKPILKFMPEVEEPRAPVLSI
jgi:hypothetical protein